MKPWIRSSPLERPLQETIPSKNWSRVCCFGPLHLLRFHQRLVWANGSWVQLTFREILPSHTQSLSLLWLSLSAKVSLELHKTALCQALTEKFTHCSLSGRKKKFPHMKQKKEIERMKKCRKNAKVFSDRKTGRLNTKDGIVGGNLIQTCPF